MHSIELNSHPAGACRRCRSKRYVDGHAGTEMDSGRRCPERALRSWNGHYICLFHRIASAGSIQAAPSRCAGMGPHRSGHLFSPCGRRLGQARLTDCADHGDHCGATGDRGFYRNARVLVYPHASDQNLAQRSFQCSRAILDFCSWCRSDRTDGPFSADPFDKQTYHCAGS